MAGNDTIESPRDPTLNIKILQLLESVIILYKLFNALIAVNFLADTKYDILQII